MAFFSTGGGLTAAGTLNIVASNFVLTGYEINIANANAGAGGGSAVNIILQTITGPTRIYQNQIVEASSVFIGFSEIVSRTGIKPVYCPGGVQIMIVVGPAFTSGSFFVQIEGFIP